MSTPDPTPLPLMTPEPVIAHVTAQDPVLPPATPASASAPENPPLSVLVPNGQAHSPAPPSEPTNRPPVRGPCGAKCRRQCSGKFSEDRRQEIWSEYWNMTYAQKRAFIFASVSQVPTEKVCANPSRQRSRSFVYRLQDTHKTPQQVCKLFYLSTLGYHPTNDSLVLSIMGKAITTALAPPNDMRGRHEPANKLDLQPLIDHIESFHPSVSHYRREHAPFRRYLPSDVTVKFMFADFIEKGKRCSYETFRITVKSSMSRTSM